MRDISLTNFSFLVIMQFVFDNYVNPGEIIDKRIEWLDRMNCRSVVEVSQGLNSFDYSRNFNLIGKRRMKNA